MVGLLAVARQRRQALFFLAGLVFMADLGSAGQNDGSETLDPCQFGRQDALSAINSGTWFALGCFGGFPGYLYSSADPYPSAERFVGQTPEFIKTYTDCYIEAGRRKKQNAAMAGAITSCSVSGVAIIVLLTTF